MILKKSLLDYIYVLFGNGLSRGVTLVNSIIIARILGPTNFGLFSIFYITMVLTWQLPQAFDITFIRYAKASNCDIEKKEFLKTAIFLKLLFGFVVCSISYPLSYFLANYCFQKPEIHIILTTSIISGVFYSFLMSVASIYQEKGRFDRYAILNNIYTFSILCALVTITMTKLTLSIEIIILIFFIVSIAVGITSIVLLWKKVGNLFFPNKPILIKSLSLGKWIFGVTSVYVISQRIDILFLTRYFKYEYIGIYSVASQITMIISLLVGSLSAVSFPRACTAVTSKHSFKIFVKESVLVIVAINIFIVILFYAAPFLVTKLFGEEYRMACSILRILLIGWAFTVVYIPFSFLFYAYNNSTTRFILELLKLVVAIVMLNLLIPRYGLIGASVAVSIALTSNAFISLIVLGVSHKYRYNAMAA